MCVYIYNYICVNASLMAQKVKNLPAMQETGVQSLDPWVRKIPWRREWLHTPVFSLGNPMDREAWWATVHKVAESDTPEHLSEHIARALKLEIPPAFTSVSELFWLSWDLRISVWIAVWNCPFLPPKREKNKPAFFGILSGMSWTSWEKLTLLIDLETSSIYLQAHQC